MNDHAFRLNRSAATIARFKMCDVKSVDYTRGNADDRLCNFKRIGEEIREISDSDFLAWAVYFLKHVDAIWQYLKQPERTASEPIESRIDDAQNYLDLLRELIREKKETLE